MIAFIFDDRLPHDRKLQFHRTVTLLKGKFDITVLPTHFTEENLIEHLEHHTYSLILMPWYKYLSWKKVDSFFGALKMERTIVTGYFADPVLAFEFGSMPTFYRHILLDFHRFEMHDIELMIQSLIHPKERTGFAALTKTSTVFNTQWTDKDTRSTHCIDEILALPLFQDHPWKSRMPNFRFFLTGLWTYVVPENAEIEVVEYQKKMVIKALFKNPAYTLKQSMNWMWPNHVPTHPSIKEMHTHSDFIRFHHYPESQQIELTAFFLQENPSAAYPNEVRGFWIEPMQLKNLRLNEDQARRVSIKSFLMHQKKKIA